MNPGVLGIPTPRVRYFEGAEQAFSAGNTVSWEHGLGKIPSNVRVVLVCKVAENSYVPGDEIPVESWRVASATDSNVPLAAAPRVSSQRISVKCHGTVGQIRAVTAASGANSTVTPTTTSWNLKAYWYDLLTLG